MTNIIAFGTFDIFHPGHKSFLKQAKDLGKTLTVVVARDNNVKAFKGKAPRNNEKARKKAIKASGLADRVVLGSRTNNYFRTLRTYNIDTIALGYDQKPSIYQLKRELKKHRLKSVIVRRLKPYRPEKFKSSLLYGKK
jgi:cytidyltransferase-like protein